MKVDAIDDGINTYDELKATAGGGVVLEVVYDGVAAPKVTLAKLANGGFIAQIEVDGLEPKRYRSHIEKSDGITWLDPPTIRVRRQGTDYKTHRALIDRSWHAVSMSATSTLGGDTGGPGGLAMTCMRVTAAVRHALRMAGEDL